MMMVKTMAWAWIVIGMCTLSCTGPPAPNGDDTRNELVVPIDSGGELEFQAGTLPADANIEIMLAGPPTLPLGVRLVGDAVTINVDREATRPLIIRLPVPENQDADRLAIFQVQADGRTTMLSTEREGDFLVAATNHFTTPPRVNPTEKNPVLQSFPELDAIKAAVGLRDEQDPVPE